MVAESGIRTAAVEAEQEKDAEAVELEQEKDAEAAVAEELKKTSIGGGKELMKASIERTARRRPRHSIPLLCTTLSPVKPSWITRSRSGKLWSVDVVFSTE